MKVHRQILIQLLVIGIFFQYQSLRSQPNNIFPENSIGIVYLDAVQQNNYKLIIRFPNSSLSELNLQRNESNYTRDLSIDFQAQDIVLFDEAGELAVINVKDCISKFWCENDMGIQYNPTFIVEIEKKKIIRTLQYKNPDILGKITCFAVINYNATHFKTFYPENQKETTNVVMRGRLSADYKGYSYRPPAVYQYYDRNVQIVAETDDSGMTDYCIFIEAYNSRLNYELGCCGP